MRDNPCSYLSESSPPSMMLWREDTKQIGNGLRTTPPTTTTTPRLDHSPPSEGVNRRPSDSKTTDSTYAAAQVHVARGRGWIPWPGLLPPADKSEPSTGGEGH